MYLVNLAYFSKLQQVRSTVIHTTTQPRLHTLLKAMNLQAKFISRVRTIRLLSWEKTGKTKEELSACDGTSTEKKKEGKRCRDAVFYSPTEKKYFTLFNNLPVRKLASIHWNAWEDSPKWNKMPMELLTYVRKWLHQRSKKSSKRMQLFKELCFIMNMTKYERF